MENKNKPPALWDGNKDPPKKGLRPPNAPSSRLLVEEARSFAPPAEAPVYSNFSSLNSSLNDSNVSVQSNLSVDAPEFYPAGYSISSPVVSKQNQQLSSIQNRLKKHRVDSNKSDQSADSLSNNEDDGFAGSADDIRLKHLIRTLTDDPGQFSDLLEIFIDTLCPYFKEIYVISRAAKLLVEQAINHHSFRYSAARLCCVIEQYCAEFRAELHLTCQVQLKNHPNTAGLLLFVAELYTQLHHENIYGTFLIDAFKHLLSVGGNENIKSICQSLKLTGYSLELYDKKALDEVFSKLIEIEPTVTCSTTLCLIRSVLNLRSSQWGGYTDVIESTPVESDINAFCGDDFPEFLPVDGPQFTSEEQDFLAANMVSKEYYTDLSDPDELYDPEPEMDEEIQAAFKEFVKNTHR